MKVPGAGGARGASDGEPRAIYRALEARFASEQRRWERVSLRFSLARLGAATAAGILFVGSVAEAGDEPRPWLWSLAVAVLVFATLAAFHARVLRRLRRAAARRELQEAALARMDRRWEDLPVPRARPPEASLARARDLQLFGHASIAQLLGDVQSPPGRSTLIRWLSEPADPEEVRRRQRVVRALTPALGFRQELAIEGRRLAGLAPEVEPFLAWCEGDTWLGRRPSWIWLARLLPAIAWSTAVAWAYGWVPTAVPLALFTLSFGVANLLAERVEQEHARVTAREREMGSYAASLELLWTREADGIEPGALDELREAVASVGEPAHQHLRRLQRLMDLADARHSGSLRFLLGTLFLWDVHTLWWLERWRRRVGSAARPWLTALGELEVLAAFAALAFEEPDWEFPTIERGRQTVDASALGHPLLPPHARVTNDVSLGPSGRVLLVTGSNMSGKSTLLRAIGINVVLAQAGAPVCARAMALPPLLVATSILVEDSLEKGLSFFLAEVLRVRDVVQAAARVEAENRTLLFLLDEILRGTNSADRRVAVREVLGRLVALGAIGAVSTHDLELAAEPALSGVLDPVHFREEVHPEAAPGEPRMTFDYRLRPGIAPTTNALRFLEMFGLS